MQHQLEKEECLYQEDVVDYLVKINKEQFLKENTDGNLVLTTPVLNAFKKLNTDTVVWVKPDRYWRFRVPEDEDGREARG
ncbi:ATP-dependent RNA helicase HrpA [Xenorhabdus bovienii]|nr:ATP-dependent RNA helicase HrpA [Xenorhabdus bovienii]